MVYGHGMLLTVFADVITGGGGLECVAGGGLAVSVFVMDLIGGGD